MIEAHDFVECARGFGYRWYAGVPCSFLTPFINYTIGDNQLNYVSSANEGDAVATCVGATLGGGRAVAMMQNSGFGNAINPLTSLAHVFRVPLLLIITLRGDPNLADEPQHLLMGRITSELLEKMRIPWEYFPTESAQINAVLARIESHMAQQERPYALVMRKGSVAAFELSDRQSIPFAKSRPKGPEMSATPAFADHLSRAEVLQRIIELTPEQNTVVIATTGYTGRELFALADRPNQLYMVGSMGCASSLGLGLSLARSDLKVVVIDGDGAALMRMGNFATIGAYGGTNLVHILLDNEVHESTGGQATVTKGISFSQIARGCGYPVSVEGNDITVIDTVLSSKNLHGPRFAHLKIRRGIMPSLPRPSLSPSQVRKRLMKHIGCELRFGHG